MSKMASWLLALATAALWGCGWLTSTRSNPSEDQLPEKSLKRQVSPNHIPDLAMWIARRSVSPVAIVTSSKQAQAQMGSKCSLNVVCSVAGHVCAPVCHDQMLVITQTTVRSHCQILLGAVVICSDQLKEQPCSKAQLLV